jgi:group I intron endonuclease
VGDTGTVDRATYIKREQFYIDWALKTYGLKVLNILRMAGSSYGLKHTKETIQKMSEIKKGEKNPMFGKPKSEAFIAQWTKDKTGANNPQFPHPPPHTCVGWGLGGGVKKSDETLAKLRKMVYAYSVTDNYKLVGIYSTVECFRTFNMGRP